MQRNDRITDVNINNLIIKIRGNEFSNKKHLSKRKLQFESKNIGKRKILLFQRARQFYRLKKIRSSDQWSIFSSYEGKKARSRADSKRKKKGGTKRRRKAALDRRNERGR